MLTCRPEPLPGLEGRQDPCARRVLPRSLFAICLFWATTVGPALAGQAKVAVAANFTSAAKEIAAAFRSRTGDEIELSFGSTGHALQPDLAGRAVRHLPCRRRGAPEESGRKGLCCEEQRIHLCRRQDRPLQRRSEARRWREDARGGEVPQDRDRKSEDGALWRRGGGGDEEDRRLRFPEGEDRRGQQYRAGLPVRRLGQCRAGLRRSLGTRRHGRRFALGRAFQ